MLSIENTSNFGGGTTWSQNQLNAVLQCADKLNLKKHLDGSRLFNASIKTGQSVKEMAKGFDTVTLCLSKGLGCPAGALLAFDRIQEKRVRRLKQLMGGAMRQSGILAAAGIYALNHHVLRLAQDHENATFFASALGDIPDIQVINNPPETNIIFFKWTSATMNDSDFHNLCIQKGLRFSEVGKNKFRAVTHLDVTKANLIVAIKMIKEICLIN